MFLGIEIGGTKLQLGIGPGDGNILSLWRAEVDPVLGADGIRQQIKEAAAELTRQTKMDHSKLTGVGIGFGGPVDDATRTVIKSHQIDGWDNFPLADWMSQSLGLPVALGNDCDCAGLAEALFGAGKSMSPVFYITIGSGIGGGLIIDGEIYRGCGRGAAEIGHLLIKPDYDSDDGCSIELEHAPLEELASGWAIQRDADNSMWDRENRDSLLFKKCKGEGQSLTAKDVADAARQGDELAAKIMYDVCWHLSTGICHVITLLCPRRIVIGGGVSLMGEEVLFKPLRQLVAERVFKPFADSYDIVPAALGEEVVVHGALALAKNRLQGGES